MDCDPNVGYEFLRWLRPAGPWALTAIPQEGGTAPTVTFSAFEHEKLKAWVAQRNRNLENIYFMVNPAIRPLNRKAMKDEIASVELLHVDVDPRAGADLNQEHERILERLRAFEPKPSAIVFSGGGYQAFWRLDLPYHVGGDLHIADEIERYNRHLADVLGGDHCHNVDRIMRLPGTVNWPNAKKRELGRTAALSAVVWTAKPGECTYPLAEFTAAHPLDAQENTENVKVEIGWNPPRIELDELPAVVSQRTRGIILQGMDPENPTHFPSRSHAVFYVACQLLRDGMEDNDIAGILMDPAYGISAHILEQAHPRAAVIRTIRNAHVKVESPDIAKLNEKWAVILNVGGKRLILEEQESKEPRLDVTESRWQLFTFEEFAKGYTTERIQIGTTEKGAPIFKPLTKYWLEHPFHRRYRSLQFVPGIELPDVYYNLWTGLSCLPQEGNEHMGYLQHIHDNICCGNDEHFNYLIRWMAMAVQHPNRRGEVAVVLQGGQGTGKGTFANIFGSLFGPHFVHVTTTEHIVGRFNGHLRDCVLLFADEAFFAGDKSHESTLKSLITEQYRMIEKKGVDAIMSKNYVHLIMASNSDWVVPAGADERRFFVLQVSDDKKQNVAYFEAIHSAMDAGGREALLDYLMKVDVSNFEVRIVPFTQALVDQKMRSLKPHEQWWYGRLSDGTMPASLIEWDMMPRTKDVQDCYIEYCEQQRVPNKYRLPSHLLGKFIKDMCKGLAEEYGSAKQFRTEDSGGDQKRVRRYLLPPLPLARKAWDDRFGTQPWPVEEKVVVPLYRPPDPF